MAEKVYVVTVALYTEDGATVNSIYRSEEAAVKALELLMKDMGGGWRKRVKEATPEELERHNRTTGNEGRRVWYVPGFQGGLSGCESYAEVTEHILEDS